MTPTRQPRTTTSSARSRRSRLLGVTRVPPDFGVVVEADMRFHQVIAEAAGNSLLTDLLTTVRSLIRVWVERAVNDVEHTTLTLREHMASAGERLLSSLGGS